MERRVVREHLADGEMGIEVGALGDVADPGEGARKGLRDLVAEEGHPPFDPAEEAEEGADGGGLAAAVRAEEAVDRARRDAKGDVVEGEVPARAVPEPVGADG